METTGTRRDFLKVSSAAAGGLLLSAAPAPGRDEGDIKVVVWDEQQPAQKESYENFLGNRIAEHLRSQRGLAVESVRLDDPEQGLSASVLDGCRVLIWWGHVRQSEVTPETGRRIVERIKSGALSLIALHSAHWSTPFVEAMNERARRDFVKRLGDHDRDLELREIAPPGRYTVPKYETRITPYSSWRKFPDGRAKAELHLPYCCFPAYRGDGKPSQVRVLKKDHPIVSGVPEVFEIPRTEMYDEPFHVPEPDEVILEERWATGEWFRSGMAWAIGKGRVFYFRPGHETYPVYKDAAPLLILTNAVRWLASAASERAKP